MGWALRAGRLRVGRGAATESGDRAGWAVLNQRLSRLVLCLALPLAGCQTQSDHALRSSFDRLRLSTQAAPTDIVQQPAPPNATTPPQATIVRGSGTGPRLAPDDLSLSSEANIELAALEGTDLGQFVRLVLGDQLGLSFVLDPRVQGTVAVQSGRRLSQRELFGLLENVLRLNGAAMVRGDDRIIRVIPLAEARSASGAPVTSGENASGYAVTVLPLRFVSAVTVQQLVEPIYQVSGSIVADPNLNLLMVAGTADERQTILAAARAFDVDWMVGRSIGIFPLQQSSTGPVIQELQTIFAATPGGPTAGAISFVPIERLNAVMVVANQPNWVDQVSQWISRLDKGSAGTRQLFVYALQHGKARDVARILSQLFGAEGGEGADSVTAPNRPSVTLQSNAFAAAPSTGLAGAAAQGQAAPNLLGGGAQNNRTGMSAAGIAATAGGAVDGSSDQQPPGGVRIIADPRNNALVVYALPDEYRLIEQALRKLDVTPLQVLVEVTIAEVTLNDELRYGLQNFFRSNSGDLYGGLTNSLSAIRPVTSSPGFNFVLARNGDPRAILTALDSITNVRVISSPQVVVLDNEKATLKVGDRVPVQTRSSQSVSDPAAPIVSTIEYVDTGVILEVLPRVNQGGMVTMEVGQQVSNVSSTRNTGNLTPTISQRQIISNVSIRTGQTVALGGLISESQTSGSSGLPVLSRLPVVGGLFGEKSTEGVRTELIVFITPRIVRSPEEAQSVTDELMRRIKALNPVVEGG
jgi:general secretion pathway protein D